VKTPTDFGYLQDYSKNACGKSKKLEQQNDFEEEK
jgi:hypothetical protein